MRAFVLMVLVLNIAFVAWQYLSGWGEPEIEERVVVPSAAEWGAPTLELVSEVPSIVIDVKAARPTSLAASVVEQPHTEAGADAASVPQPVLEPVPAPETDRASVADKVAAAALSESNAEVDKVETPPSVRCYQAGPFEQQSQPQALVALAEQRGFDAVMKGRQERRLLGDWIYLTEYETVSSARADVTALKGQGIEDISIARLGGELIISLGVYSQEASLKRRLQELKGLGYVNYQTRKSYRNVEQFWLMLSGIEGEQQRMLVDELNAALSERFPQAQLTPLDCR